MTQMSSTQSRMFGNRSLTSVPHLPPGRNSNRGLTSGFSWFDNPPPALVGLPCDFTSSGLKSNVSRCDTPPDEKIKITRFALAGKCVCLGVSGSAACSSAAANSASIPGNINEAPASDRKQARRETRKYGGDGMIRRVLDSLSPVVWTALRVRDGHDHNSLLVVMED